MKWLEPDVLIGGFHFMKEDVSTGSNARLDEAAVTLKNYGTRYYTCHCTGVEQFAYMKERMGDALQYISAGQVFTV